MMNAFEVVQKANLFIMFPEILEELKKDKKILAE